MARSRLLGLSILAFLAVATPAACGGGSSTTTSCSDGCDPGKVCRDGRCVDGAGGAGGATSTSTSGAGTGGGIDIDGGPTCPAAQQCGSACCDTGLFCALGTACAVDQGT